MSRLREALGRPTDVAGLAAFRVLLGLLMAAAMGRSLANGWVRELYVEPRFWFAFEGFEWIRPWPGPWMHVHFVCLVVLGLMVAAGLWFRVAAPLLCLGFTWVELLDKTNWLNHYYLMSLLCGLVACMPAHRALSVDAWRDPRLGNAAVPAWTYLVLRFQVAVVWVYAGVAKLDHDWLLAAEPMRTWLAARSDLPFVGPLLDRAWVAYAASWAGAAYDLAIVPLLCWRRTRTLAFVAVVGFHVATWVLFRIGMFPWVMIAAATLFFAPSWPRRWLPRLLPCGAQEARPPRTGRVTRRATVALLGAYACVQVLVPLRPFLAPGPCGWDYRGFNFSWRVMIAEKAGHARFFAFDPDTGSEWEVPARRYLTERQCTMMAQDPWMIRTFARHLAEELRGSGHPAVQVRALAHATLNGRPSQPLIDRGVDLAGPLPEDWIVPLQR